MHAKDVPCDIYIGTDAGIRVLEDIESAESSVRIVSPYLSSGMVDKLMQLYRRGVSVELLTMAESKDALRPHMDELFIRPKRRIGGMFRGIMVCTWVLLPVVVIGAILQLLRHNAGLFKGITLPGWIDKISGESLLVVAGALLLYILLYKLCLRITRNLPAFQYTLLFPIRVFKPKGRALVHSKVYIIDNRIIYLGSLNFSRNGMEKSFETHMRSEDMELIEKTQGAIEDLQRSWEQVNLQEWAQGIHGGRKQGD